MYNVVHVQTNKWTNKLKTSDHRVDKYLIGITAHDAVKDHSVN